MPESNDSPQQARLGASFPVWAMLRKPKFSSVGTKKSLAGEFKGGARYTDG